MPEPTKTPHKKQAKLSRSQTLRQRVKDSGLDYDKLAFAAGIPYGRFRRIVVYSSEPTLDEAAAIDRALSELAQKAIERLSSVASSG